MLSLVGLVSYADDPHQRVFRKVYPSPGDPPGILDDPQWTTLGVDPGRSAVMRKVTAGSAEAEAPFHGTPWTKATDPLPIPLNDYVASPELVQAILAAGRVGPGDVLYDLGSGDGPILIAAARLGARAVGIEMDPARAAASIAAAKDAGVTIDVRLADFRAAELSDATVITLNLGSQTPSKADLRGIRAGTRIVVVGDDGLPHVEIA